MVKQISDATIDYSLDFIDKTLEYDHIQHDNGKYQNKESEIYDEDDETEEPVIYSQHPHHINNLGKTGYRILGKTQNKANNL